MAIRLVGITLLIVLLHAQVGAQCGACEALTDRIENGDFESGNTGFTSSLNYVTFFPFVCTLCPENSYAIGNNATLFHSGFSGTDHTNPPTGDFFIANAPGLPGAAIWCQNASVLPNTLYTFTFWARDIANNNNPHPLAVLRPSFNGVVMADSLLAQGDWSSLSLTWFSDSLDQVEICIIDFQSQTGGNDFGLDDISMTACEPIVLSQAAFAGNDTTLCSRDVLTLGITPAAGYSYIWNDGSALSSPQISNPAFSVNNTSGIPMEYLLTVTRDSAGVGCVSADTVALVVLPMNEFDLGDDITICAGDSVELSAGTWDSQLWTTGETEAHIIAPIGEYAATVFTGLCSETDTIRILPFPMPETGLSDSILHCHTESLFVNAAVDGTWIHNAVEFENPIVIETSGTYYFHYSANSCEATDTVEVLLFDLWTADLGTDTTLCEGTTAMLSASHPGSWNTGFFGIELPVSAPGIYAVEIANGPCLTSDTIGVVGLEYPTVVLGADTTFCEDFPLMLDAFNENASYVWSTGDTTSSIFSSGSGLYSVEVSNACGNATDDIAITNYPCSWQLFIPTCFTPNDDTFNEGWKVSGYNIRSLNIHIYNRLGDAIFRGNDIEQAWIPSPGVGDDVYTYRIEVTPYDGPKEVRTGAIYLVR